MSGRNPPSYCTLTLIAMQGHQQKGRQNNTSSNNKDKSNTIIETRTAEDHDDENLHDPETVQDAVIHLEVDQYYFEKIPKNDIGVFRAESKETPHLEEQRTQQGLIQSNPRHPILNTKYQGFGETL